MRKHLIAALALSAAAVLAAPQVALAQPSTYDVSGTFTNDCGDGAAWIELRDSDGVPVQSNNTADGGTFTFTEVGNGAYTVVPYAPAGCGTMPYPGGTAITVEGADVTDADVGLVEVHSIRGLVTGCEEGDGNGINNVTVTVDIDIDIDELTYNATTQTAALIRDGQFFFQYLPAVDGYTVTVTPPEGCITDAPSVDVDLTDADVDDVVFELATVPSPAPSGSLGSLDVFGSLGSLDVFGSLGSLDSPGSPGPLGSHISGGSSGGSTAGS